MRGDRFTLRQGDLVYLSRERRSASHKVRICFRKTRQKFRNGTFRRIAEQALFELRAIRSRHVLVEDAGEVLMKEGMRLL